MFAFCFVKKRYYWLVRCHYSESGFPKEIDSQSFLGPFNSQRVLLGLAVSLLCFGHLSTDEVHRLYALVRLLE